MTAAVTVTSIQETGALHKRGSHFSSYLHGDPTGPVISPHCTCVEPEAQRGQGTGPRSWGRLGAEPGLEWALLASTENSVTPAPE